MKSLAILLITALPLLSCKKTATGAGSGDPPGPRRRHPGIK